MALDLNSVPPSEPTYRRCLDLMHECASSLDCRPEELEYWMFLEMAAEQLIYAGRAAGCLVVLSLEP